MMRWEQRPVEVSNLLNPAFCAVLLRDALAAYEENDERGMNYLLIYLILPLLLHHQTRQLIPVQASSSLLEWIERQEINTWILVDRIQQLIPYTKEALIFGIQQGKIAFGTQESIYGNLLVSSQNLPDEGAWPEVSTPVECRKKAKTIGKWFGEVADATTIYRTFGIRP